MNISFYHVHQENFHIPVTVYYEDTDIAGIVYHANYLKYFERARTEWLRAQGFDQSRLFEAQTGFAVRAMQIDFISAATLDDQLTVYCQLTKLKGASMLFEQLIIDQDKKELCKAEVLVACIHTKELKPMPIPREIKEVIQRASS